MKQGLLNFFGGPKPSNVGDVWVVIDPSEQPLEHKKLQGHPLYGVKGWALVLLWWLIASSILGLVLTYSNWYVIKELSPRAFIRLENNYTFDLFSAWSIFGWSCANALWLWNKNDIFRMSFFSQLLSVIFLIVVSSIALGEALGGSIAPSGLLAASLKALVFLVPLVYVFRSRRISVTCDSMLRHDDSFFSGQHTTEPLDTKNEPISGIKGVVDRFALKTEPRPTNDDTKLYAQAWEELESSERDNGLWAKAFADSDGDDDKTKAFYIKSRVQQLKDQHREEIAEEVRKEVERRAEKEEQERKAAAEQARKEEEERVRKEEERAAQAEDARKERRRNSLEILRKRGEKAQHQTGMDDRGRAKNKSINWIVVSVISLVLLAFIIFHVVKDLSYKKSNDPVAIEPDGPSREEFYNIGRQHAQDKQWTLARKAYEKAAHMGHPYAQYLLGMLYTFPDRGVKENWATGLVWFLKAGKQGHMMAQYVAGLCYLGRKNVEQDLSSARKWYRKVVDEDHLDNTWLIDKSPVGMAAHRAGWIFEHFDDPAVGNQEEKTLSLKYYRIARENGYSIEQDETARRILDTTDAILKGDGFIGAGLFRDNDAIRVKSVLEGSPADKEGILGGDEIIQIDDTPVGNMSLELVLKRIRGKPGTKVKLMLLREGVAGPFTVTVVRSTYRHEWG